MRQYTRSTDVSGNKVLTVTVVNSSNPLENRRYDAVWKASESLLEITHLDPDGTSGPRESRVEKLQYSGNKIVSITSGSSDSGWHTTSFSYVSSTTSDGGISMISYPDGSSLAVELTRYRNAIPATNSVSSSDYGGLYRIAGDTNPIPNYAVTTYKRSSSSSPQRTVYQLDHRGRVIRSWDPEQVKMMSLDGSVTWNNATFATLQSNLDRSTEYVRSTTTRDVYGNVTSNDWGEVFTTISPDPDKIATTNGPRTRQTTTISYSNNNPTSVDSPLVSATAYTWNDTYDAMTSYTDELGNKVYQVIDSATGLVTQRRWEQKASTANWQNASLTVDVNGDTFVSPIDALAIVNYVNSNGEAPAAASSAAPPYLDVDGNGLVTNADADYVIAYINAVNSGGTPYAPPTASTSADTIQQVDITYVTTSGLPKGLVATETVQTGRTSGTRVTTYQYINNPSDPARHARVSSITETGDSVNAVTSFTYL